MTKQEDIVSGAVLVKGKTLLQNTNSRIHQRANILNNQHFKINVSL